MAIEDGRLGIVDWRLGMADWRFVIGDYSCPWSIQLPELQARVVEQIVTGFNQKESVFNLGSPPNNSSAQDQ